MEQITAKKEVEQEYEIRLGEMKKTIENNQREIH